MNQVLCGPVRSCWEARHLMTYGGAARRPVKSAAASSLNRIEIASVRLAFPPISRETVPQPRPDLPADPGAEPLCRGR